jgi:hypothetical protein
MTAPPSGIPDPARLIAMIEGPGGLKEASAAHASELPPGGRVPDGHYDELVAAVKAEQDDADRVTRAASPQPPGGVPAPPPVIYLSRKPSVTQFMSAIHDCIESEFRGESLQGLFHARSVHQIEAELEHLADDLRSRFRRFGPCDVRFIEPKLAEMLANFTGKHRFGTDPVDAPLGADAVVIIVGDWATGLPQALNVAARIGEFVGGLAAGTECHVIHLGDTYYSGYSAECRHRFLANWPVKQPSVARSWTLAGNHDMYTGGYGYFDVLLQDERFAAQQGCSYFALSNEHWQILGVDSSYSNPDRADLEAPQPQWLAGRIDDAGIRQTILLSHHQPYSAFDSVDQTLANTVAGALAQRPIAAWLWGHEHRCVVYRAEVETQSASYKANAAYTATIGHGGVPQLMPEDDRHVDTDAIAWQLADCYQVGKDRWSLGGFAALTFTGRTATIQYYDEYGKAARTGPALIYPEGEADLDRALAAADERPIRPPDTLGGS